MHPNPGRADDRPRRSEQPVRGRNREVRLAEIVCAPFVCLDGEVERPNFVGRYGVDLRWQRRSNFRTLGPAGPEGLLGVQGYLGGAIGRDHDPHRYRHLVADDHPILPKRYFYPGRRRCRVTQTESEQRHPRGGKESGFGHTGHHRHEQTDEAHRERNDQTRSGESSQPRPFSGPGLRGTSGTVCGVGTDRNNSTMIDSRSTPRTQSSGRMTTR